MKKDKLVKIIKESVKDAWFENQLIKADAKISSNDFNFTESSEESKEKIRNLILRLARKRDEIEYGISEHTISIYATEKHNNTSHQSKSNYFHIEVIKEVGYNITCNSRRVLIKDITLYDEMLPKIKETFDTINLENFNDFYNTIMKDNGLNRESNLDELLNGY
jgi:hypothetical protein